MKNLLLFALAIIPVSLLGQKISESEIDKFTGSKRVETEYVNIAMKMTGFMKAKLRSVDTTCFINFWGDIGTGVIGKDDATTFLFEDKSTLKVNPTGIQTYDIGTGKYSSNRYSHQYHISIEQIKQISNNKIVAIRREYNKNYLDIEVKEKNAEKLSKMCSIFLEELSKK